MIKFGLPLFVTELYGFYFRGVMTHVAKIMKEPSDLLQLLFKVFSMFKVMIFHDTNDVADYLRIKCINYNKVVGYELGNNH